MKNGVLICMLATALAAATPGISASLPSAPGASVQMVVTVVLGPDSRKPQNLGADDLAVSINKIPARFVSSEPLTDGAANMQLFVLLDNSLPASTLGLHLPALKSFLGCLPATTQVAVGYMQNGTFSLAQAFTTDHQKAEGALHLPMGIPGENGSPYFALSDLAKHWPSKEPTGRRAVLMLTDGVDRYYGAALVNDPYVDTAVRDALKQGVMVYSIYLRDAGLYDRSGRQTLYAQSRLNQVSQQTGGYAYFQDFSNPVSLSPFLTDLQDRFEHQYRVTVESFTGKGVQPVQVRSELPGVKIQGPTRIFVQ
ncbi:MAG TPA: hypothetical protein VME17_13370 [Bryobacteraceae bacterium]|nr:hypothetical protein [Bryobacteraceae bacterium]